MKYKSGGDPRKSLAWRQNASSGLRVLSESKMSGRVEGSQLDEPVGEQEERTFYGDYNEDWR